MHDPTLRLHEAVAAVTPIHGVSIGTWGDSRTVRNDFKAEATTQQRRDAQRVVDQFDWSDAAHEAWLNVKERERAKAMLADKDADCKLIRAAVLAVFRILKNQQPTAALTKMPTRAELEAAIKSELDSGTVD